MPTLLVGGLQDAFLDQTLEQYQALRARGVEVGLTVGPWTHLGMDLSVIIPESLAWLDAHLAGEGPPPRRSPVRVWVGGRRHWRDLAAWPPAGLTDQVWHLLAGGRLSPAAPASGQGPATSFRYDPADPTPSVGGRVLSVGGAGQQDNTSLEARADVLTFTSAPLSQPVEVLGAPMAELRVSSDNPHIDLFARLCDLDRRGRSRNITDRIIRVPVDGAAPGVPRTVRITLDDTAHRFLVGHRIRLQVSAGAHPRYARNLGTGEPDGTGTTMTPAIVSIHHSAERASTVTLPVGRS